MDRLTLPTPGDWAGLAEISTQMALATYGMLLLPFNLGVMAAMNAPLYLPGWSARHGG